MDRPTRPLLAEFFVFVLTKFKGIKGPPSALFVHQSSLVVNVRKIIIMVSHFVMSDTCGS